MKANILVVDDLPVMRKIITHQLKQAGFSNVMLASSVVEATELLSQAKFDLVLSDWKMPEKDGLVDLESLLKALGRRGITSVLVEGGGDLLGSLFDASLVDKVLAFVSPMIIGGKGAKTPVAGKGRERVEEALSLHRVRVERFGNDVLMCGYTKKL